MDPLSNQSMYRSERGASTRASQKPNQYTMHSQQLIESGFSVQHSVEATSHGILHYEYEYLSDGEDNHDDKRKACQALPFLRVV